MRKIMLVAGLCVAALMAGCATAPRFLPTKTSLDSPYPVTASASLDETNHVMMHLDTKRRVLYQQQSGGGGVAVGLLLGPLGVMANISMIEAVTKADVARLKDRLGIDPVQLFEESAGTAGTVAVSADSDRLRATPYVLIAKAKDGRLHVFSALLLEQGAGPEKLTRRFMYQLPSTYTLDELASGNEARLAQLRSSAVEGFRELLKFASPGEQARLPVEQPVNFYSDFMTPQIETELRGDIVRETEDRIWISALGGVFAVTRPNIRISKRL